MEGGLKGRHRSVGGSDGLSFLPFSSADLRIRYRAIRQPASKARRGLQSDAFTCCDLNLDSPELIVVELASKRDFEPVIVFHSTAINDDMDMRMGPVGMEGGIVVIDIAIGTGCKHLLGPSAPGPIGRAMIRVGGKTDNEMGSLVGLRAYFS